MPKDNWCSTEARFHLHNEIYATNASSQAVFNVQRYISFAQGKTVIGNDKTSYNLLDGLNMTSTEIRSDGSQ